MQFDPSDQIRQGINGEKRVFGDHPRSIHHAGSGPALPKFWSSPYVPTSVDVVGMVTHMREERVLEGQTRHCICTNASRVLSATAEFLVYDAQY